MTETGVAEDMLRAATAPEPYDMPSTLSREPLSMSPAFNGDGDNFIWMGDMLLQQIE